MVQFESPWILVLILPVLALLFFLIRRDSGSLRSIRRRTAFHSGYGYRPFMLLSRSAIFILLITAIASPFSVTNSIKTASPSLTVLIDNSTSMDVLDLSGVPDLISRLEHRVPVEQKTFSGGNVSAIGDALITSVNGQDNVLLVSDGRSNYGRSLDDMLVLAYSINSTINALDLKPAGKDSSVTISGPRITTNAEKNEFKILVTQVGEKSKYRLIVTIDDAEVINSVHSGSNVATLQKKFSEGYHTITAEIITEDHFPENNVFYKTVKVEPRPDVLLVQKGSAPVSRILNSLYAVSAVDRVPQSLDGYSAVILDDIPASEIPSEALSSYVADGNGLVVFGGKNSYDRGGYRDSIFESILPVQVGKHGEGKRTDVTIALVIDVSGSTGSGFGHGTASRVQDVEKTLAIGILEDLKPTDRVVVIAFNSEAYVVSDLGPVLGRKEEIKAKISRLVYQGRTRLDDVIKATRKLLAPLEGSKNMIILSDGRSDSAIDNDLRNARIASEIGVKIHTVGVGHGTNRKHMQDIAAAGNGYYFEPDETERLKVIFGESEEAPEAVDFPFEIVNSHHFITSGVKISGKVDGYNEVVPKPHADLLVATQRNNPLVTASRLGLGRIVAVSTDDGSAWASDLLAAKNSVLITRAVNWAVGDLGRNKKFDVDAKDVHLGDRMGVNVISGSHPDHDFLAFEKIGNRLYSASHVPQETGLHNFFNAVAAVNYPKEYVSLGMSPDLEASLAVTGGKLFNPDDADSIVKKVKEDSRRTVSEPVSHSWILLLAALVIFLSEIALRRFQEGKAVK